MNIFALSGLLIGITSSIMGFFVYSKNPKNLINRVWLPLAFSIAVWGFGSFAIALTKDANSALFFWRLTHMGIIFIPVLFLHFIYVFLEKEKKWPIVIGYLMGGLFLCLNFTNLFIKKVEFVFNSFYYDGRPPTILYVIFTTFWFFTAVFTHYQLFREFRKETGVRKNQIKYFFFATIIGYGGGSTSFLPVFGINIYPYGNFTVCLYPIIMSYAIVKYRLMDIKAAITRTGIFIAVYTLVLGLPFALAGWLKGWLVGVLGSGWWMVPLSLMAVLATVGPFIYIYLDRKAEEKLLSEQRRYQRTLKQASIGMTRIRSLKKLLDLISRIVTKTVGITYMAVYLYDEHTDEYVLQLNRDKGRIPVTSLPSNNSLVSWVIFKREPIIYEEIKRKMQDTDDAAYKHLEENMRLLNASVIIPSFLENKFMGFFVLGDKISGQIYTVDDLNVFQVLASQAALAIENAKFYEEAKEMQEQIFQAEKMATIGTMADGLSHQINNRFYALSLIAGDSIDTIKMTDVSNCSSDVKNMINELNHALERIQLNVMQGGEVVRGMLKYSRPGEVGFEPVELNELLNNTIEMVKFKVKMSEIDIARNFNHIAKIKGNMVQLEEAFFNFIDNAYDAIVERRVTLKEEGYRGKITISAKAKTENILEIIVEDNGIGVKEDDTKKVFTPFFTTKVSARKGTGLGLYVIKRIITDVHKGKISFESKYKRGTRFILELPAVV